MTAAIIHCRILQVRYRIDIIFQNTENPCIEKQKVPEYGGDRNIFGP